MVSAGLQDHWETHHSTVVNTVGYIRYSCETETRFWVCLITSRPWLNCWLNWMSLFSSYIHGSWPRLVFLFSCASTHVSSFWLKALSHNSHLQFVICGAFHLCVFLEHYTGRSLVWLHICEAFRHSSSWRLFHIIHICSSMLLSLVGLFTTVYFSMSLLSINCFYRWYIGRWLH